MSYTTVCRAKLPDGSRCGVLTTDRRGFCPEHVGFGGLFRPSRRRPAVYSSRAWRDLRAEVIRTHLRRYGQTCPGWRCPPHPASDLTVDHIVPLVAGGSPLDRGNTRVLCRSCNSRKSLRDRQQRRP